MKRKITSLILCLVFFVCILSSTVSAATLSAEVNSSDESLVSTNAYGFDFAVDSVGKVMISSTSNPDYYVVSVAQVEPYVNLTGRLTAPNQAPQAFDFYISDLPLSAPLYYGTRYRVWVASVVNGQIQTQKTTYFTYFGD